MVKISYANHNSHFINDKNHNCDYDVTHVIETHKHSLNRFLFMFQDLTFNSLEMRQGLHKLGLIRNSQHIRSKHNTL